MRSMLSCYLPKSKIELTVGYLLYPRGGGQINLRVHTDVLPLALRNDRLSYLGKYKEEVVRKVREPSTWVQG